MVVASDSAYALSLDGSDLGAARLRWNSNLPSNGPSSLRTAKNRMAPSPGQSHLNSLGWQSGRMAARRSCGMLETPVVSLEKRFGDLTDPASGPVIFAVQ
jgi:hypothetical protein